MVCPLSTPRVHELLGEEVQTRLRLRFMVGFPFQAHWLCFDSSSFLSVIIELLGRQMAALSLRHFATVLVLWEPEVRQDSPRMVHLCAWENSRNVFCESGFRFDLL